MATLTAVIRDLREQWDLLRAWLEELPDPASAEPSTLPGWSIGVLVAHLGRNLSATSAAVVTTPEEGETVNSIAEYVALYRTVDPARIDRNSHAFAAEIAADPLERLDELATQACARLDALAGEPETTVVRSRNGDLIGLTDFLRTRLIEMVVHAYDLAPALPLPSPVDPTARTIVAEALLEILSERTGDRLEVGDPEAWILAATGRIDWPCAVGRGAVRPLEVSDGTPDLTPSLPLL